MASISMVAYTLTGQKSQPDILEYIPNFCFQFFWCRKNRPPSSLELVGFALPAIAVLVSLQGR